MHVKTIMFLSMLALASRSPATTRYVSLAGGHAAPYTDWAGAATTIQAAISASAAGDWIWVSNGTYEAGVTPWPSLGDNRIAITTAVTVAAWDDDRTATIIKGGTDVRPVFMADNVTLSGFTITNGHLTANNGGGIRGHGANSLVSNCLVIGNSASGSGGGVYSAGYLFDSDIVGNQAAHGGGIAANLSYGSLTVRCCNVVGNHATSYAGGVRASYVFDSQIISNTAVSGGGGGYGSSPLYYMTNCVIKFNFSDLYGGGVNQYNLFNCEVISNSALNAGGGTYSYYVQGCLIAGNIATNGGGVCRSHLNRCEIRGNYAVVSGGGVYLTATEAMTNCLVIGNESGQAGGVWGNTGARVENCTIAGNAASSYGGARHITACNVIAWSNHSNIGYANQFTADDYSCAPECTNATSITADPRLFDYGSGYGTNHVAGDYRLQKTSPCINAGTNLPWMANAVDLGGRARMDRFSRKVDMGCYEYLPQGMLLHLR